MLLTVSGGSPSGPAAAGVDRPVSLPRSGPLDADVERLPERDALALLASSPSGLSSEQARERLAHYGPNRLPELRRRSPLYRFLAQFRDFFAILLEVAGTITLAAYLIQGDPTNLKVALAVYAVVLLNAVIGFVQEYRAERTAEALMRLLPRTGTRAARRDADRGRGGGTRARRPRPLRRGRRGLRRLPPARGVRPLDERRGFDRRVGPGSAAVGARPRAGASDPGAQPRLRRNERRLRHRSRRRLRDRLGHRVRAYLPARGLGGGRAEPAAARGGDRRPPRGDDRDRARCAPVRIADGRGRALRRRVPVRARRDGRAGAGGAAGGDVGVARDRRAADGGGAGADQAA